MTYTAKHPLMIWSLLLICCVAAVVILDDIFKIRTANRLIADPNSIGKNTLALSAEVIFAQAYSLNAQGNYLEAFRLYTQIEADPSLQERVQYNIGSAYLQQAAQLWNSKGVWEAKQIHTLLDLAEQSLRRVLTHNPGHWRARYNLEYALRIRPPREKADEAEWQGQKSSIHAIMPGIPAGGP